MVETVSQAGIARPKGDFVLEKQDLPEPGEPAQSETDQAHPRNLRKIAVARPSDNSRNYISMHAVSIHAFILTKKSIFNLYEHEFNTLRGLQGFVLSDPKKFGIIPIEYFLEVWHRSRKQSKVIGSIHGLASRGYVQIFDQRKNGTRYIGITPLGAKLLEVYYSHVDKLMQGIVFKRDATAYDENAKRFQRVPADQVGNLYTRSMTTKNRHLYDASKYYNEDGSIKE